MPPEPPFAYTPPAAGCPVLVSVTHAGRDYPPELLADARVPAEALAGLEDPFVDALAAGVTAVGAGLAETRTPRAFVDLNRAPDDLDPGAVAGGARLRPGPRARGGLGVVPTRLAPHGPLWRRPLAPAELARRLDGVHRPFHALLSREMARLHDALGVAVLLDLHSMPAPPNGADLVLGDLHGASCDGWLPGALAQAARRAGAAIATNAPYAGGHVVEQHGAPMKGAHAIQIELSRALYLQPDGRSPGPGWARTRTLVEDLVRAAADAATGSVLPLAAE